MAVLKTPSLFSAGAFSLKGRDPARYRSGTQARSPNVGNLATDPGNISAQSRWCLCHRHGNRPEDLLVGNERRCPALRSTDRLLRLNRILMFDFIGEQLTSGKMEVIFLKRLRDEQKFSSPEALREQVLKDIEHAKNVVTIGS